MGEGDLYYLHEWANPRGNAIRGRPVDGVEQAHSTRPVEKNTGNFVGLNLETVAEITLQRTDTTHDLSSESREAITKLTPTPNTPPNPLTTDQQSHLNQIEHKLTNIIRSNHIHLTRSINYIILTLSRKMISTTTISNANTLTNPCQLT